jgi:chromosomal replication initiator protein
MRLSTMRDNDSFIADPSHLEPFLLLAENRFAHAAIQQSIRRRQNRTPLVYLYGPAGIGKSHLATQFLKLHLARNPASQYSFRAARDFADDLAIAIRKQETSDFQDAYRQLDVLILENVESLERRESAQWELLWTLDSLRSSKRAVLITSQKRTGELSRFIPRLVSRFRAGVSASVEMPSLVSRIQLIEHFSSTRQIPLTKEAGLFLAENLPISPADLLAALESLDLIARDEHRSFDREFAKLFLPRLPSLPSYTIPNVADAVARRFRVNVSDLRSRARGRGFVVPRQCAMLLAREFALAPHKEIGSYFGNRSHSTVIYACQKIEERIQTEPELRQQLQDIRTKLRSRASGARVKNSSKTC